MSDTDSIKHDQQALQRFVVANRDLAELEALIKRFNIFEALGVHRTERVHSSLLGFLLNPKENHGLGDRFLKRFLQTAMENPPKIVSLTAVEIDLLDLSQAEIRIEHNHNDVLIRDARNHIGVIVENKIDSTQHSDQLARYHQFELKHYPERTVFGIYLTVDGDEPENDNYASISHSAIPGLLAELCQAPGLHIDPEVQFAIRQYTDVLGRHFMADQQIKTLCERLYRQHRRAIDLIVEYMPRPKEIVREKLKELIRANGALILDECTTTQVRFIPKSLDLPYFQCGERWTSSRRIFLFEFVVDKSLCFFVELGPGDPERRKCICDFALANEKIFQLGKLFYEGWQSLLKKQIVERLDEDLDTAQLAQKIESRWQEFLKDDLPRIEQTFLAHEWPKAV